MGYFFVGLFATTLGAIAGLGGGVIIKPVLDALGQYDLGSIGILSSATVFSMAIVSLLRAIWSKAELKGKCVALISLGSILGGVIGKALFRLVTINDSWHATIGIFQSMVLALLMTVVMLLVNNKKDTREVNLTHPMHILMTGLILGMISAFLGIGGGPLNVAILSLFFGMKPKESVIHSILIIFFSQGAGLVQVAFTNGFSMYQLDMLLYMIPGGILGGVIGSVFSSRVSNKWISCVFNATLVMIICLNFFNAFSRWRL
ncbi:MAG: sulfite exporter TauE/SafE family protein [Clostridiales bacterium]|nr:MAG: sulfite exporter TauE/SafE family protein [Clostridiales bacterium]